RLGRGVAVGRVEVDDPARVGPLVHQHARRGDRLPVDLPEAVTVHHRLEPPGEQVAVEGGRRLQVGASEIDPARAAGREMRGEHDCSSVSGGTSLLRSEATPRDCPVSPRHAQTARSTTSRKYVPTMTYTLSHGG